MALKFGEPKINFRCTWCKKVFIYTTSTIYQTSESIILQLFSLFQRCPSREALHSHIAICPKRLACIARRVAGGNVEELAETQAHQSNLPLAPSIAQHLSDGGNAEKLAVTQKQLNLPRRFLKARNVRLPRRAGHLKKGPLSNYFCNDLAFKIASYAYSAADRAARQKSRNRRFDAKQRRLAASRLLHHYNDKRRHVKDANRRTLESTRRRLLERAIQTLRNATNRRSHSPLSSVHRTMEDTRRRQKTV